MATNKKSFLLYTDLIHTVKKLPKEKSGELFVTILEYVNDLNPIVDDLIIQIAFEPIKQQLKRDLVIWENICNRNKTNGLKGGRPKNPDKPKKPNGIFGNPDKPKKPDNDNDNDNETNYLYSDFYNLEIQKSNNDPNYIKFIKTLFGENTLGIKLNGVLSMKQITFDEFLVLLDKAAKKNKSLIDMVENIENGKYYKKNTNLNKTLHNWINR